MEWLTDVNEATREIVLDPRAGSLPLGAVDTRSPSGGGVPGTVGCGAVSLAPPTQCQGSPPRLPY